MRPFQNPARAIALPMAMRCIDPSNLLEDGAVFILGDSVDPFRRPSFKKSEVYILPKL
jgi:hypothetical protein